MQSLICLLTSIFKSFPAPLLKSGVGSLARCGNHQEIISGRLEQMYTSGRLPHEELEYDDERIIIYLYDTFMATSVKLLGKQVRYRTNVLYHLLKKIDKEPNADMFPFMKGASHQRTEEFVFDHLVWSYSPIRLLASKV